MRLLNKTALITGAAQGIGLACAKLFIKEGATVILSDINHDDGQKETLKLGEKANYYGLDVCEQNQWNDIQKIITEKFKSLDILVNNAGITGFLETTSPQDPENATLESWHKVHHVNLDGVFLGCQMAIKVMKEKGGSIINLSSRSGVVGIPGAAAYASSKAGIRNHTKTVALYCAEKGYPIRCNSLHPAAIMTPMWDAMLGQDPILRQKILDDICSGIPLKKMGDPLDVAYAALYLASDESSYITGSEFTIDGGILAGATAAPNRE